MELRGCVPHRTIAAREKQVKTADWNLGSDGVRAKFRSSHAGPHRPQQERRKVRMIGGFGVGLALRTSRFGAADRGHARDRRRRRWREGFDRGFRLRLGATAGTSRFALGVCSM